MLQSVIIEAQPVIQAAAGYDFSLLLKSDGSLWALGNNASGELGDGTYNSTNHPEMIMASNVTDIAAGGKANGISSGFGFSLILKTDGSLWAMGDNQYGELGDGTFGTAPYYGTNLPEEIVASNVTMIAAGASFSLFLKSDGSLWGMGFNGEGQLGDGTYSTAPYYGTNLPEEIETSNVVAIAAGANHSLFLKGDGSLWAMGNNAGGQLGDGTYNRTNRPEMIVSSNVIAIAAGGAHSLFMKTDGTLWAMGDNSSGELGIGTSSSSVNIPQQVLINNVKAFGAGGDSTDSLFIKNDESLWDTGHNNYGQLGNGTTRSTNQPEMVVVGGVTAIAGGTYHNLFVKNDGSLWGMGDNSHGELDTKTTIQRVSPVQIVVNSAYNHISPQLLGNGDVSLSFTGIAGTNYELDWSPSLSPPGWLPQVTNSAGTYGLVMFTNTPEPSTNNFWRVRAVP